MPNINLIRRVLLRPPATVAGGGGPTDPYWTSTKLLMGFEGTNGSTGSPGYNDESSAAHGTATTAGSPIPTISTSQFDFGASSLSLTGAARLEFANSADFQLGSNPFTLDLSWRPANISGTQILLGLFSDPSFGWRIYQSNATLNWQVSTNGSNAFTDITSGNVLTANTWSKIALDYDGSKYRMYAGGTMIGSSSTPRSIFASTSALAIGGSVSVVNPFFASGNMDELRITKGVGRYASDAGYTVATAAFPRS